MTQRKWLAQYGGHSVKRQGYFKGTVLPILLSPKLSLREKYGTAKRYKLCLSHMWPTIVNYDFLREGLTFRMPYYIFQGRMDNTTPSELTRTTMTPSRRRTRTSSGLSTPPTARWGRNRSASNSACGKRFCPYREERKGSHEKDHQWKNIRSVSGGFQEWETPG